MIKKKKGGLTDIFIFLVIAFALVIICPIFYFIGTTTYDALMDQAPHLDNILEGTGETGSGVIGRTVGQVVNAYESLKWITVILIFGMVLSMILGGFLVRVNPIFFVPYILISIIAIIVSVPMSNAYEMIYLNPHLAESFSGFYGQTYIFLNLPIWVGVIMALAGIIMFINMVKADRYGGYM